jgi:MFS family permease
VARGWLVYTMTDSSFALGLVTAGFGISMFIFSLYGGAVADRVEKRNLMVITRGGMGAVSLIITILITLGRIELWHLIISSLVSGAFMAFYMPGRQAFVMELVGKDSILNAIALNSIALNICRIASPALAGILIKLIGLTGVYWVITISSLFVVLTLLMIPPGRVDKTETRAPVLKDIVEGLKHVLHNKIILLLLLIGFIPILTAMPYQLLMPVFAKNVFKAGETGLGLLMSAVGVGALSGSTLIASLGNIERKGLVTIFSGFIFGGFLILFALSPSLLPALVFLFIAGIGSSMYMTLNNTLVMTNIPEELIGRVMSIYMMTFGLMPLATLPAGALADIVGAPYTVAGGASILVVFILFISIFTPQVRKLK